MLVVVVLSAALRIFMSLFSGSQQFSCYSGFSDSFEWAGPYKDLPERYEHSNYVPKISMYLLLFFSHIRSDLCRDEWARRQRQILAIDALHFKHRREQYNMRKVTRELNKVRFSFVWIIFSIICHYFNSSICIIII